MKRIQKLSVCLFAWMMGAHACSGAIEVGGSISTDTTWTGEVLVIDDVIVGRDAPATLTIENATVRFARRTSLVGHTRIIARNSTFLSAAAEPQPGDWRGIRVEPAAFAFLPAAPLCSEFRSCRLEHAQTGLAINYRTSPAAVIVTDCEVKNCRWGGMTFEGVENAKIESNRISEIGLQELSAEGRPLGLLSCSKCSVSGNSIRKCSDTGIALVNCEQCEVVKNSIEQISGGPHGSYQQWGMGIALVNSDDNRLLENAIQNTAYIGVWIAYGSDRNRVTKNRIQTALDGIAITGSADLNECRENVFSGVGWSVLYVCGDDRNHFGQCSIDDGGFCFTARTGQVSFSDCQWKRTSGMNFWGDSRTVAERCCLTDFQGDYAVNLRDQSQGTMIDCDFDKAAMTAADDSTGGIDVKYHLKVKAVDSETGKAIDSVVALVRGTGENAGAVPEQDQALDWLLTEFRFDKAGKHWHAPYEVKLSAPEYQGATVMLSIDKATQQTVTLVPLMPAPSSSP